MLQNAEFFPSLGIAKTSVTTRFFHFYRLGSLPDPFVRRLVEIPDHLLQHFLSAAFIRLGKFYLAHLPVYYCSSA